MSQPTEVMFGSSMAQYDIDEHSSFNPVVLAHSGPKTFLGTVTPAATADITPSIIGLPCSSSSQGSLEALIQLFDIDEYASSVPVILQQSAPTISTSLSLSSSTSISSPGKNIVRRFRRANKVSTPQRSNLRQYRPLPRKSRPVPSAVVAYPNVYPSHRPMFKSHMPFVYKSKNYFQQQQQPRVLW